VTLWKFESVLAGQGAKKGEAQRRDAFRDQSPMPLAANPVGDDAGDFQTWVVAGKAADDGGGGLGLTRDILREQNGPAQKRRDIRASADAGRAAGRAVEEAHGAFCNDNVGMECGVCRQFDDQIRVHRPGIEIKRRAPRGGGVKSRIDVIGTAFDRCNP